MRSAVLVASCALVACGDNLLPDGVPLVASHDVVIVAHQDDDLLFMQPDVIEAVRAGGGVTNVYVTAGNAKKGIDYSETRYDGLMAAYRAAAGGGDWFCGWIELAGHVAEHCRLDAGHVSLVFLAYPDGLVPGDSGSSLLHLWEGTIDGADTVARRSAHYDRDGLIDAVAEVLRVTQPTTIRTLEVASTHGHDHSDHMLVGALTLLATARANSRAELLSYRGYNIVNEPANKIQPIFDAMFPILAHYEACATGCAPCGDACTTTTIDPKHVTYLQRRYAVGFRATASGQLRFGAQCADINSSGSLTLGDCATAGTWQLDEYRQLHIGTHCLDTLPTGELVAGSCSGGVSRSYFLDDEGHLWTGVPPAAADHMDLAHLWCLDDVGGRPRFALCGADHAPVWEFAPAVHTTPRASLGITSTGRAVRIGDLTGDGKGDLCAVEPAGLTCATGDGAGGFGATVRIDSPTNPLAIDPNSLVIGDVDGDGRLDACGRDSLGILCSTANASFMAQRWTPSFADTDARLGTSASLAAVDADDDGKADICGLSISGVICAPKGLTITPIIRSAWPDPAATVWPGDLDGDHLADWCASTATGPACGVEAMNDVTTDGVPWGFSLAGTVDPAPMDPATSALGDIDGDGRADLCSIGGGHVTCARSQGRGFGPRTPVAPLDGSALWLGDLDGDGIADICVDTGTAISCTLGR